LPLRSSKVASRNPKKAITRRPKSNGAASAQRANTTPEVLDYNQLTPQTQLEAFKLLAGQIPLNEYGLPLGIYRPDMLPWHEFNTRSFYVEQAKQSTLAHIGLAHLPQAAPILSAPQEAGTEMISLQPLQQPLQPATDEGVALNEATLTVTPNHCVAGFPSHMLQVAVVSIAYQEGFPTLPSGAAFWQQLDFESPEAFASFQQYLMMPLHDATPEDADTPLSELNTSSGDIKGVMDAGGARSLYSLAATLSQGEGTENVLMQAQRLQEYFTYNYWPQRAKAFDMFRVVQFRKMQEVRAIELQNDHYIKSNRLFAQLMQYFESEEDFWDMLTPKVAIDMLKVVSGMQRLSSGLPAGAPKGTPQEEGTSVEVMYRTIAQEQQTHTVVAGTDADNKQLLANTLSDPTLTNLAQELIIKMSSHKRPQL